MVKLHIRKAGTIALVLMTAGSHRLLGASLWKKHHPRMYLYIYKKKSCYFEKFKQLKGVSKYMFVGALWPSLTIYHFHKSVSLFVYAVLHVAKWSIMKHQSNCTYYWKKLINTSMKRCFYKKVPISNCKIFNGRYFALEISLYVS